MGNKILFDKNNDRIVEINGFTLIVHDDHKPNRINVICYSNLLQLHIMTNGLKNDNTEHTIIIGDLINENAFIDIEVIKVKGHY